MSYWDRRKHLNYYHTALGFVENLSGEGILDVGGWDTPMVLAGEFQNRLVVNLWKVNERLSGVEYHIGDFLAWPVKPFDVVLCLQVLEHLSDESVARFARKLFETATRHVVISVPYKWRRGASESHLQDPVDEHKLRSWTGQDPTASQVVTDGSMRRLVAFYNAGEG